MKSTVVSVTTAATPLIPTAAAQAGSAVYPMSVVVLNQGSETLYIGGPDVTTANGFPLAQGSDPFSYDFVGAGDNMYGICATGPVSVRVLRRDL